jgi:hypothetical protein
VWCSWSIPFNSEKGLITRRIQLTGWGYGGARIIFWSFELPLPAADAQALGRHISQIVGVYDEMDT